MMKPQGTIKLLTDGVRIGLLLLVAGVGHGFAQTASTPNDVRKVLSQAPAESSKPAPSNAAQTKPSAPATPAKPATAKTAPSKPAPAKPAAPQAQAKTPSPSPATAPKSADKPVQSAAKPAAAAPPNSAAPQVIPVAEHSTVARRDPFDPLVDKQKEASGPQAPLPAGKPGLMVASLRVDGLVRGPNGMIAVVSNPQMRVYFLREGDHLYDGEVAHITMEGVSFHQTGKDAFGKNVERESTKRLYPTPGEQQ
jgi:hypothetical protein